MGLGSYPGFPNEDPRVGFVLKVRFPLLSGRQGLLETRAVIKVRFTANVTPPMTYWFDCKELQLACHRKTIRRSHGMSVG